MVGAQRRPRHAGPLWACSAIRRRASKTPGYSYVEIALEIWRIVYKRKWLIVGIAAAIFAIGAVRTLMQVPLYTATVRLQIDRNVAKIVKPKASCRSKMQITTSCGRSTSF